MSDCLVLSCALSVAVVVIKSCTVVVFMFVLMATLACFQSTSPTSLLGVNSMTACIDQY